MIFFLYLISAAGCARSQGRGQDKYSEARMLMGTIVHLDVCRDRISRPTREEAYAAVWERLEDISWRMNVLDERSDVARINHAGFVPVPVGADTYYVLARSADFARATGGAFDISVWPLIALWKESAASNVPPSSGQIKTAQASVGIGHLELLDGNRVRRINGETRIDLGGVAKGYAIDEAARIFREHQVDDFFIDAGGDVYAGGRNCRGEPWRIGVRDPRDQTPVFDVVEGSDLAVATSGNYEQYYQIGGERWSHIIDPRTGYPQRDVVSATMIAPTAMEADAWATALCVLGAEDGTVAVDALDGTYASLILVPRATEGVRTFESRRYTDFQRTE